MKIGSTPFVFTCLVLLACLAGCSERQRERLSGSWVNEDGQTLCLHFASDEQFELWITDPRDPRKFYTYTCSYEITRDRITATVVNPPSGPAGAPPIFAMDRPLHFGDQLSFRYKLSDDEQELELTSLSRFSQHKFTKSTGGCPPNTPS